MLANLVKPRQRWLKALWLGLAYAAGIMVSRLLSNHDNTYISFWLPAGVYVAGLLLVDTADWLVLVLAVNAVNIGFDLHTGAPLLLCFLLALANTVEAVTGAYLFRRFVARTTQLKVLKEFLGFAICSAIISTALGATIGAAVLVGLGYSNSYLDSWTAWWIGNTMAIFLVSPFVLAWVSPSEEKHRRWKISRRLVEAALLISLLFAGAWQMLVHGGGIMTPNKSVLMLFILWAGLRFGVRGVSAVNLLLALLFAFLTSHYLKGLSPEQVSSGSYVFTMQMFLAISALVGLVPAIALTERDLLLWQQKRAEEALQRAHDDDFRFLADTMPQIIWTAKPDGNIDYHNQRWIDYTGLTFEQTKDWGWQPVIHPDDLQNCVERWTRAFTTGDVYEVEYRFKRASDGAYRWHLGRALAQRDSDGQIRRWVGTCTDIHDQKRNAELLEQRVQERTLALQSSEEQFRMAFDFAGIGMALVGLNGQWLRVNRALCDIVGYTEQDLLEKTFQDITHPDDLNTDLGHLSKLLAGEANHYQMEKRYIHREGHIVWIRLTASLVRNASGDPAHFVSQIENITKEKLTAAEREKFVSLAENSQDFIGMCDLAFTPFFVNTAGQRLLGLTDMAAACRVKVQDYFFPEDRNFITDVFFPRVLRDGHGEVEIRFRHFQTGKAIWMIYRVINLLNERGVVVGWATISSDITGRKRTEAVLHESEERTRLFAEHAPAAVAMFDTEMRYLIASAKWLDDYGLKGQSIVGRSHYEVFPDIPERWKDIHQRCLAGATEYSAEDPFDRANGIRMWLRWEVRPWLNDEGTVGGIVMFTADITELKELQQQLVERNNALEVETRRAQDANRLKSEFLANMSHELRTPLNGIIGFSSFLVGEKPGPLNAKQKDFLGDVLNSSQHLLRLINDLLDLAKIEAGKIELTPELFSLRALVKEVVGALHRLSHDKLITIKVAVELDDDRVMLDLQKTKQVLFNLLSNAIKFTDKGGAINLHARLCGDGTFQLSVTDTGIGIKPEDIGKLFVQFTQLDPGVGRRHEGTGLGLALTKKLVELQHGRITVESEPGKGSTFTVILPLDLEQGLKS